MIFLLYLSFVLVYLIGQWILLRKIFGGNNFGTSTVPVASVYVGFVSLIIVASLSLVYWYGTAL